MDPTIVSELANKGPAVVYLVATVAMFMMYRNALEQHRVDLRDLTSKYEALLREAVIALTQVSEELKDE